MGWAIDVDEDGDPGTVVVPAVEPALIPLGVLLLHQIDEVITGLRWRIPPGVLGAGLPAEPVTPRQLRVRLLDRRTGYPYRDAVWAGIVRHCRGSDARWWRLIAVGLACPGLRSWCDKRPPWSPGLAEVHADLAAGLLQRLATIAPDGHNLAGRLISSAIGYARRQEQQRRNHPGLIGTDRVGRAVLPRIASLDIGLARVVAAVNAAHPNHGASGRIDATDALLIGRTRLERHSVVEVATQLGLGTQAAYKRRQRAEALIAEHYGMTRHRQKNRDGA